MIFNMRFNFALSRLGITSIVCIVSRIRKYVNVLLGIYSLTLFNAYARAQFSGQDTYDLINVK